MLTEIANTPRDTSAALDLSVLKWTYYSCTGIHQIWLEIWPELDLPEPEPKSSQ